MSRGPAVPPAPRAPVRSAVVRRLFASAVNRLGPLEVVGPGGEAIRPWHGAPRMTITSSSFFDRIATQGNIGFAEAYMAREWHADDLAGVLSAFAAHISNLVPGPLRRLRGVWERREPSDDDNTPAGSARNISRHYDLSNDLFALFLDETMTYSCAVFEADDEPLGAAQRRKYELVSELAGVEPGMHVLEIGTGWGGMAMHLAGHGCRVTTATLSTEQAALAARRIRDAGLDDAVDIQLRDYRQLEGRYDAIVSIEMFEAVGERYWPAFFAECDRLLEPGGAVGLQTITMPHTRYLSSHRAYTWVKKYIFPGGAIPSQAAIDAAMARASGLRVTAEREIGAHYARTLRSWRERFLARLDDVHALGFGDTFVRMWELYLAYCEAGFATGALGDAQLRLERR